MVQPQNHGQLKVNTQGLGFQIMKHNRGQPQRKPPVPVRISSGVPQLSSQMSSAQEINPLATQAYNERTGQEDLLDDEMTESPNIGPDGEMARFDDFTDEEMGDIGNENVNLMGLPSDDQNRPKRGNPPEANN